MSMSTILVIDDDKLVRWSMSRVLGQAGYRVHEVSTGTDRLAAVRDCPPDLVLLDITLPDVDGLSVLKKIHQIHPEMPVLMITGEPSTETRKQALQFGAYAHLEKPCDFNILQDTVFQALQLSHPSKQGRR